MNIVLYYFQDFIMLEGYFHLIVLICVIRVIRVSISIAYFLSLTTI